MINVIDPKICDQVITSPDLHLYVIKHTLTLYLNDYLNLTLTRILTLTLTLPLNPKSQPALT